MGSIFGGGGSQPSGQATTTVENRNEIPPELVPFITGNQGYLTAGQNMFTGTPSIDYARFLQDYPTIGMQAANDPNFNVQSAFANFQGTPESGGTVVPAVGTEFIAGPTTREPYQWTNHMGNEVTLYRDAPSQIPNPDYVPSYTIPGTGESGPTFNPQDYLQYPTQPESQFPDFDRVARFTPEQEEAFSLIRDRALNDPATDAAKAYSTSLMAGEQLPGQLGEYLSGAIEGNTQGQAADYLSSVMSGGGLTSNPSGIHGATTNGAVTAGTPSQQFANNILAGGTGAGAAGNYLADVMAGNTGAGPAGGYASDVLSGTYTAEGNPYISAVAQAARDQIEPAVGSRFALANRGNSVAEAGERDRIMGNVMAPLMFQDYARERGLQQDTANRERAFQQGTAQQQFGAQNQMAGQQLGLQQDAASLERGLQQQAGLSQLGLGTEALRTLPMLNAADYGNLSALEGIGNRYQGLNQDIINAELMPDFTQNQFADANQIARFQGQASQVPVFSGGSTSQQPFFGNSQQSSLGGLMSLASLGLQAYGTFSDRRLKKNIKRVGTTVHDLPLYEFEYKWGPERYRGVMSDDVRQVMPEAVMRSGEYDAVNYGLLGIEMERA